MRVLVYIALLCSSIIFVSCDACRKVECENGGTCVEGICDCPEGYSGTTCNVEDLCVTQNVVCENGHNCITGTCDCKQPYYGELCADYCLYGTYNNGDCDCNEGISGENCDVFSRDKFIGTYTYESNDGGVETCIISRGEFEHSEVWKVEMTNLSSFSDTDGYAEVSDSTISFPDQTVLGQGSIEYDITTTTSGQFEDDGENITFTIKVTRLASIMGSTVENDTYKYSRPSL